MVAWLENNNGAPFNTLSRTYPGADRLEHRDIRRARNAMKHPVAQGCRDFIRGMSQDDDHLVADRPDGVISGGNERYFAARRRPQF